MDTETFVLVPVTMTKRDDVAFVDDDDNDALKGECVWGGDDECRLGNKK